MIGYQYIDKQKRVIKETQLLSITKQSNKVSALNINLHKIIIKTLGTQLRVWQILILVFIVKF